MAEFDWMESPRTPQRPSRTAQTRDDEIIRRATMYAYLGVARGTAERRLQAYATWECERLGKPTVVERIPALVAAAYERAGVTAARKKRR
jgi:hypothetical protein